MLFKNMSLMIPILVFTFASVSDAVVVPSNTDENSSTSKNSIDSGDIRTEVKTTLKNLLSQEKIKLEQLETIYKFIIEYQELLKSQIAQIEKEIESINVEQHPIEGDRK